MKYANFVDNVFVIKELQNTSWNLPNANNISTGSLL